VHAEGNVTRRERPYCRRAIEKFGLRFAGPGERGHRDTTQPANVVDRAGRYVGVSQGILMQLRKQAEEQA
jgi:hypothetical protein